MNSDILQELLNKSDDSFEELDRKASNLKDLQGMRLSKFWGSNDSILSVSLRKTKNFFFYLFNPHNYSTKTFYYYKNQIDDNKTKLFVVIFVFLLPLATYFPIMLIKSRNSRNSYYL